MMRFVRCLVGFHLSVPLSMPVSQHVVSALCPEARLANQTAKAIHLRKNVFSQSLQVLLRYRLLVNRHHNWCQPVTEQAAAVV